MVQHGEWVPSILRIRRTSSCAEANRIFNTRGRNGNGVHIVGQIHITLVHERENDWRHCWDLSYTISDGVFHNQLKLRDVDTRAP